MRILIAVSLAAGLAGCSVLGKSGVSVDPVVAAGLVADGVACSVQVDALASSVKDQVPACVAVSKSLPKVLK